MAKIYYDRDVSLDALRGKVISIIGYGIQGYAQANNMRDSGLEIVMGLREGGPSWKRALQDNFKVYPIPEAVQRGDIILILIPDEEQEDVYKKHVAPHLREGKTVGFSHGFNIFYGRVKCPKFVDVIMMAPKGPGSAVREAYLRGSGIPAAVAIWQNYTGTAFEKALAWAKSIGATRDGVIETTFREEVETDLFGEQAILIGGVPELIKAGFETLVEAGYQPEVAYFECLNELKLIVDLIYEHGIEGMWAAVSNTAEYGGRTRGPKIINERVRKTMKKILKDVQSGTFTKEWVAENQKGIPNLKRMREVTKKHLTEKVGRELRELAGIEKPGPKS
jgi:ketol-acid reductoisomerase